MADLEFQLADGTRILVPASLDEITTYVLLEQEDWFEKEARFAPLCLQSGDTAIDIGANVGIYALPMARRVGPSGHVYAYEPAVETRRLLSEGCARNGLANLTILPAALSDRPRESRLASAVSSELRALSDGAGEAVPVTSLDAEDALRGWSPDFVKIDAEGEEPRILQGAASFFTRHSPLAMFEVQAGLNVTQGLQDAFRAKGYGIYRLLPSFSALVPFAAGEALDASDINLFAAKPDRAEKLADAGRLILDVPIFAPGETQRASALDGLHAQSFTETFRPYWREPIPEYRLGLEAYAVARDPKLPLAQRCGALIFACDALKSLCVREGNAARFSTLARVAAEAGRLDLCTRALQAILDLTNRGPIFTSDPFWPPDARFDALALAGNPGGWLMTAVVETLERVRHHSSLFEAADPNLAWVAAQPFASAQMQRRLILRRLRAGERLAVPDRLLKEAPDHRNAEIWRNGLVPNTIAKAFA